ncbi:MAG: ABC transporter ATP-binding protein [Ilumatobacteraceae bacterium]
MNLTVEHGSCCVVMGRSGAGKSTLLKAIAGLVPHSGSVTIDGRGLGGLPPHRRRVGMLFQEARLFPTMSALDNVAYPLRVRGVGRGERREQAAGLLERVGLDGRAGARATELSGGEQQRVALARALCSQPAVLLLDEPFTGLDVPQRRSMVDLLALLRRDRAETWVIVSHDPDDALRLGDTVAILDDGALVQHAPPADARARPASMVVTALLANPNLLSGRVTDHCLALGDARIPWLAPDGAVTLTISPERVRLRDVGDRGADRDRVALPMSVSAVEHRSVGPVAVLDGVAGHLEVGCCELLPEPGQRVTAVLAGADLWQLGR